MEENLNSTSVKGMDVGGGLFNMGVHMSFWTQLDNWSQALTVGGKTNVVLPFSSLPSKFIPTDFFKKNKSILGTDSFGIGYFGEAEKASGQNVRTIYDYLKNKKIRGGGNFRDSGLGVNLDFGFMSKKGIQKWSEKIIGKNIASKTMQGLGSVFRFGAGGLSLWASMPSFYLQLSFQVLNGIGNYLEGQKLKDVEYSGENKRNINFFRNGSTTFQNTMALSRRRSIEIENMLSNNINLAEKF